MSALIPMEVRGLMVDPSTNVPMVLLKGSADDYVLPIWVGVFEANAIALELEKIDTPRPMTHDLMRLLVEALDARVERVEVTEMRDATFHATIVLERDGAVRRVDARPSDAIALALRARAPVFVTPEVIEQAKAFDPGSADPVKLREWFEGLAADAPGAAPA